MSTSIEDILAMISGGGDSAIELKDIADQTAIARALKNRQVAPVMSSGRATLPNISGILETGMDRRQATRDESRLMADRLRIQNMEAERARQGVEEGIPAIAGIKQFDSFEDSPAARLPMQAQDPAALEEEGLLRGATAGAPAKEAQDTLRKYALSRALEKARRQGGGTTTLLQLTNRNLAEHPEWTYEQAKDQAIADLETYSVHKVGGGIQRIGNRRGDSGLTLPGGAPAPAASGGSEVLSTLPTEANAAATLKASEAEGSVIGEEEAKRKYMEPKARAAMEAAVANYRDTVTKAKEVRDIPGLGRVTGMMALLPSFWGGQAKDKENSINTLKIAMGFDRLQEMRNSSPTGGALGQISDKEGEWLQNAMRNLELSNSKEQFVFNLNAIIERMEGFEARAKKAFADDFTNGPTVSRPTLLNTPAPAAAPVDKDPMGLGI